MTTRLLIAGVMVMAWAAAAAPTQVQFTFIDNAGNPQTNAITLTPAATNNVLQVGTAIMVGARPIQTNVPGTLVVALAPNRYTLAIAGTGKAWVMNVMDTNVVVPATSLITGLPTYTYTNSYGPTPVVVGSASVDVNTNQVGPVVAYTLTLDPSQEQWVTTNDPRQLVLSAPTNYMRSLYLTNQIWFMGQQTEDGAMIQSDVNGNLQLFPGIGSADGGAQGQVSFMTPGGQIAIYGGYGSSTFAWQAANQFWYFAPGLAGQALMQGNAQGTITNFFVGPAGIIYGNAGGLTNIVVSGPTNSAPSNTTSPKAWANFTNSSGGVFKLPLYQ